MGKSEREIKRKREKLRVRERHTHTHTHTHIHIHTHRVLCINATLKTKVFDLCLPSFKVDVKKYPKPTVWPIFVSTFINVTDYSDCRCVRVCMCV